MNRTSRSKRRLAPLKKERLRLLTPEETDAVRGGDPPFTHFCGGGKGPNCPNDSRYCLD
jgi:hypothetical protein